MQVKRSRTPAHFQALWENNEPRPTMAELGLPKKYKTPIEYFEDMEINEVPSTLINKLRSHWGVVPLKEQEDPLTPESKVPVDLSSLFNHLRKHGMPQRELADRLGIRPITLKSWKKRQMTIEQLDTILEATAEVLGSSKGLKEVREDILAQRIVESSAYRTSKPVDLTPLAELVKKHRYTLTEVARNMGMPRTRFYGIMYAGMITDNMLNRVLDAAVETFRGNATALKELRQLEKELD